VVLGLSVNCMLSLLGRSVLVVFCVCCVLHILQVQSILFQTLFYLNTIYARYDLKKSNSSPYQCKTDLFHYELVFFWVRREVLVQVRVAIAPSLSLAARGALFCSAPLPCWRSSHDMVVVW
jgi:hypothetical protein